MADILLNAWTFTYLVVMALFLLGVTVFVHEAGHFIVARRCGLVVKTFSIGFGRALFQWEKGGIRYKIGWIPFGGYVALPQLDPEGMEKIQGGGTQEVYPDVSPWKKIAVAFCGPLGNIALAIALAWVVFLASHQPTMEDFTATIGTVEETSTAYQKGLRPGDTVTAVNGKPVGTWTEFVVESFLSETDSHVELTVCSPNETKTVQLAIDDLEKTGQIIPGIHQAVPCLIGSVTKGSVAEKAGLRRNDMVTRFGETAVTDWMQFIELVQNSPQEEIPITVEREGRELVLSVVPTYNTEYDRVMIGVGLGSFRMRPLDQLKSDAFMIFRVLQGLINPDESGKVAKNLQGPVGIFGMLMTAVQTGILSTLGLLRLLNVNLAILNLLPIPVLDGGHILFALWHGVTRRKVHAKVQSVLVNIFAALLISALLLISFNDIDRKLHIKKFVGGLLSGQTEEFEHE